MFQADFDELANFRKDLYRIDSALGETAKDPYWSPALRKLKYFLFDLCAAPIELSKLKEYCNTTFLWVQNHLSTAKVMYPAHAERISRLLHHLVILCGSAKAPLFEMTLEIAGNAIGDRCAMLISESRLVRGAQLLTGSYSELQGWEVASPANLRSGTSYDYILSIGAPHWFPEYVFTAPRAICLDILTYKWLKSTLKFDHAFIAPGVPEKEALRLVIETGQDTGDDYENAELLVPSLDLQSIMERVSRGHDQEGDDEFVQACAYVLPGRWVVLLEDTERTTALVLDLDEDERHRVKRIGVGSIETGMYLLLRTSGGGDFIVPVADRILGDYSTKARRFQKEWKDRLRARIKQNGISQVVELLRELGSSKANEQNVRNWSSYRSIRTQEYTDFKAIMNLVGLGDKAEEYWEVMGVIDAAHRKAGFHIRDLLLRELNQIDHQELERTGLMEIELEDKDAGSMGVFCVRSIESQSMPVLSDMLGEPFLVDDYG